MPEKNGQKTGMLGAEGINANRKQNLKIASNSWLPKEYKLILNLFFFFFFLPIKCVGFYTDTFTKEAHGNTNWHNLS